MMAAINKLYIIFFYLVSWLSSIATAQDCTTDGLCDTHERCPVWAAEGECFRATAYMEQHCPASCKEAELTRQRGLGPDECGDLHERCSIWATAGECESNKYHMKKYCKKACNFCGENLSDDESDVEDDDDDDVTEEEDEEEVMPLQEGCTDQHELCSFWAEKGECKSNPGYMENNCPVSCGTCKKVERKLTASSSVNTNLAYPDDVDPEVALQTMEQSTAFGLKQVASGVDMKATLIRIVESANYMKDAKTQSLPKDILDNCSNKHEMCAFWATVGECEKNKAYMTTQCSPSCFSCNMIDIAARCPPLEDAEPALHPGDLNKMFERIVATAPGNRTLTDEERAQLEEDKMPLYTVHIHSQPGNAADSEVSVVVDKSLPPWVISFEDFLTEEECQALIDLGYKYEYKRSEDVGERKFDGTFDSIKNERRTSENAWCSDHAGCRGEEVAQRIHNRMSKVMGIPAVNSEDLQLLRYEKGQFYRTHHDFIPHQVTRQCGPRILTFFLYLSDVEAGGGTNFPNLDITVMPKRGRALLWPSVFNSSPLKKDGRFMHQALDVEEGVKYAANGWIHMYDYIAPQKTGCT